MTKYLLDEVFVLVLTGLLHPVEVLAGGVLELEYEHTPSRTLRHTLELSITREDDQILQHTHAIKNVHEYREDSGGVIL